MHFFAVSSKLQTVSFLSKSTLMTNDSWHGVEIRVPSSLAEFGSLFTVYSWYNFFYSLFVDSSHKTLIQWPPPEVRYDWTPQAPGPIQTPNSPPGSVWLPGCIGIETSNSWGPFYGSADECPSLEPRSWNFNPPFSPHVVFNTQVFQLYKNYPSSHNHGSVENGSLQYSFPFIWGNFPFPWLWEKG